MPRRAPKPMGHSCLGSRFRIVEALAGGEQAVGELVRAAAHLPDLGAAAARQPDYVIGPPVVGFIAWSETVIH
jgi:hypothetical protein